MSLALIMEEMNQHKIFFRAIAIVSQRKSYEDQITNQTIVVKILRSLISKFNLVITAIEESKNLFKFLFDELMGSL